MSLGGFEMAGNVDEQFDEYRDCVRLIWNFCLRHRRMGLVSFDDVSRALLGALVFDDLKHATDQNTTITPEGYYPALGVAIRSKFPEILFAKEDGSGLAWGRLDLASAPDWSIDIRFMEMWDFRDIDGLRDFDYVKCYLLTPLANLPGGTTILIRRSDATLLDRSLSQ